MKSSQIWKRWYIENLALSGARIVRQTRDTVGPIRVVDFGPYRSLYFDSPSCQGRIHKTKPWIPASDYITSMAFGATLAEVRRVERILVLGLGPGAILHTLRKMYPEAKIETIEVRQAVIDLAIDMFKVPDDEKVDHIKLDAVNFFQQQKATKAKPYDYVIVDLAVSEGPSPVVTQPAFWSMIGPLIDQNGIICINLWRGKEHMFDWTIRQMTDHFSQEPLCVEHKHIENIMAFSSPSALSDERIKEGLKRLVALEERLELNVRGGLEFLLRQMMELESDSEEALSAGELEAAPSEGEERSMGADTQENPALSAVDGAQGQRLNEEEEAMRVDPYDPSAPPEAIEPVEFAAPGEPSEPSEAHEPSEPSEPSEPGEPMLQRK